MIISISKFGTTLMSRPSGREAWLAFQPTLQDVKEAETVEVDFDGVKVFSPSWGDEFLTPLQKRFGKRLWLKNTTNPSVALTMQTIADINGVPFQVL